MDTHLIILCFVAFCVDNYVYYKTVTSIYDVPKESVETILGIKNALLMVILSITHAFLQTKEQIAILGTLYFLSFLFMDIYIGNQDYHKAMLCLSGNFHHLNYIVIGLIVLSLNLQSVFMLFMISEIPTIMLNIGRYKRYRNDMYFGLAFLLTRIVIHSTLVYTYRCNKLVLLFGLSSLGLHAYWFKNWCSKYLT